MSFFNLDMWFLANIQKYVLHKTISPMIVMGRISVCGQNIAFVESKPLVCWLHQYFSRILVKDSLSAFISNCLSSTETQKNANEFNESKLSLPAYCYLCHTPGKLRCWQCLMNRVKSQPFQETRVAAGNGLNATAFLA